MTYSALHVRPSCANCGGFPQYFARWIHDDVLELRDARLESSAGHGPGPPRLSFHSHGHDARDYSRDDHGGGGCHGRVNSEHRSLDLGYSHAFCENVG